MKKIAALLLALALFPALSPAAQASGGRVYAVSGNVYVAQGKNPAHRVTGNEVIVSDTLVNTGYNSSALLRFEDGQVVTMQGNSAFHVREYRYDARKIENSNIVFSMFKGGMRFITGLIGQKRKQAFRLSTPNATIGIRGTEFMVTMADKSMYSHVLLGNITMTNATGMTVLRAGQTAVVPSSGAMVSLVSAAATPSGTFSELLSIPVDPSAIPAPAPAAEPDAASDAGTSVAETTAGADVAASAAGASIGVAGGALAGMAGSDSDSAQADSQPAAAVADLQETVEPVAAADEVEPAADSRSGMGVTGKIGTLGYGAELNLGISDNLGARVGVNAFNYKYNANSGTVNYDFKLQLQTVSVLADWYPFAGGFRASAGVLYNNNKVTLNAIPGAGSYTINGVTYTSSQVSSLQGTMTFNKVAPYFGLGWGNPVARGKGWGLVTDVGVLFQGSPKLDLLATCATSCPGLQANAEAENAKLQSDLSNFKFWPVASIGISYQW